MSYHFYFIYTEIVSVTTYFLAAFFLVLRCVGAFLAAGFLAAGFLFTGAFFLAGVLPSL
jgi:hypothetical protein